MTFIDSAYQLSVSTMFAAIAASVTGYFFLLPIAESFGKLPLRLSENPYGLNEEDNLA